MPQHDKSRHWLGELFPKVAVRVGRTPEERLAWLLEFAERSDVRGQTVDFEELLAEIAAFAIAEGWHTRLDARPSLRRSAVEQLILDVRGGLRNLTADPPRPWEFRTAGRNLTWSVGRDRVRSVRSYLRAANCPTSSSGRRIGWLRLSSRRWVRVGAAGGCS